MKVITELSRKEWGGWVRKDLNGETFYFAALNQEAAEARARIFEELWIGLGGWDPFVESKAVPIEVACAGKPAIAAYLYACELHSADEISDELGIASSTVNQYIADIKAGRRL